MQRALPRTLAAALLLAGCAAALPARFTGSPVVDEVADDTPIPLPRLLDPIAAVSLSRAYVRRPVVEVLDPRRVPDARDVNALDQVPRSSWFCPGCAAEAGDDGEPPAPPFRVLTSGAESGSGGLAVLDARGRPFELLRDPPDRPEMRTAAAVVASRLAAAAGYLTAPAWALDVAWADLAVPEPNAYDMARLFLDEGPAASLGRYRVAAVRWPIGLDRGPTPPTDRRGDDPNDRVTHLDRRTLRALPAVFGWLGLGTLSPAVLRDAYVGAPGSGHLLHYLVDLGDALGAGAVVRPPPPGHGFDPGAASPLVTLGTLGLYRQEVRPTQRRWLSIGELDERFSPGDFSLAPPFAPADRALPADLYWAAKRMLEIPDAEIDAALDAARLGDVSARARLAEILRARRLRVAAWAFSQVVPLEVVRVDAGERLVLRDEAAALGVTTSAPPGYEVVLLDDLGREVAPRAPLPAAGAALTVALPVANRLDYLVVRVSGAGGGPRRAFEAHLRRRDHGWTIAGIRH
jgi:hypothetical protein